MSNNKIKAIIFDVDGVVFKTHDESGNYLWSQSIQEDLGLTSKHFSVVFSEKWESIIRGKIKLDAHLHAIFQEPSTPTRSGSLNMNRSKRVSVTYKPCQTGCLVFYRLLLGFVYTYGLLRC